MPTRAARPAKTKREFARFAQRRTTWATTAMMAMSTKSAGRIAPARSRMDARVGCMMRGRDEPSGPPRDEIVRDDGAMDACHHRRHVVASVPFGGAGHELAGAVLGAATMNEDVD